MTELTVHEQPTELTLADAQTYWTENQVAALQHMGIEDASQGDLSVFFHVVKRTGLDPFARQIHMIGRNSKNQRTQQWETKYTIQTGIDGYRLIGRRAADRARVKIRTSAPEWAHEDGSWRPIWSPKWGHPVAARVTVYRDGEPFPGVALFEEYKQTKRDGNLTSMWAQRPAGQIAKCAEALAWRQAFPQDLASVYVEDEMHQAANPEHVEAPAPRATAAQFTAPTATTSHPEATDDATPVADAINQDRDEAAEAAPSQAQVGRMFALFGEVLTDVPGARTNEGRAARLAYIAAVVGREVESSKDLSVTDVSAVIDSLQADKQAAQTTDADFAAAAGEQNDPWEGQQ